MENKQKIDATKFVFKSFFSKFAKKMPIQNNRHEAGTAVWFKHKELYERTCQWHMHTLTFHVL